MTVNNNDQTRIARAGQLSLAANREFLSQNRELLVYFSGEAVSKSMSAIIRLEHADEIRSTEPNKSTYLRIQERAFLAAFDRGAVVPLSELSSLAWDAVERMRRDNGIGVAESLPVPEPVLTPQQKIDLQVKDDWKRLPSAVVRKHIANDRSYREAFERVSGELESAVTTRVLI